MDDFRVRVSNPLSPVATPGGPHKETHATGGSDELTPADIGATSTAHDHTGGNGAQIDYATLSNLPTLGTASALDVGTSAGNVVLLNGSAQLPAVDGSLLTGLPTIEGDYVSYIPVGSDYGGVFILSPYDTIESGLFQSFAITTSSQQYASGIGRTTKPVGATGRNSDPNITPNTTKQIPWSNDTGYVSGSATVATILGGYDHVCNQIAGTCIGGGHNYIQYNVNGHATILGGSSNRVAAGRGGTFASTDGTLLGTATGSVIGGGSGNTIGGTNAAIMAGSENVALGNGSSIIGGSSNQASATNSAIIGGSSNTIYSGAANAVVLGGTSNTVGASATYSAVAGTSNSCDHTGSLVSGRDGVSDSPYSLTIARSKLVTAGDAQTTTTTMGVRTTSTTLTSLVTAIIPTAVKMAIGIRSIVIAMDESTGESAMFTWDGLAQWDGSSATTFYDSAGSGTTRNFTQIVDNIGCGAVPMWAGNSSLRPKVTGKTSTNIKWVATVTTTVTRM